MHLRDVRRANSRSCAMGRQRHQGRLLAERQADRIEQYSGSMADAGDFQLMVDFHGSTIPRGWSRDFPHFMSMEAVFGAEQYKFMSGVHDRAWHNTVLAFTRNVSAAWTTRR